MPKEFNFVSQLIFQANQRSLTDVRNKLQQSLKSATFDIDVKLSRDSRRQIDDVSRSLSDITKEGKSATAMFEGFASSAGRAGKNLAGFTLAVAGIGSALAVLRGGLREMVQFDRELVRFQQLSGATQTEVRELSQDITRLSTSFGVSSLSLAKVSVTMKQAGLSVEDTKRAMEALAKASLAPTFGDMQTTAQGAIAIMKQFGVQAKDLEKSFDAVNSISSQFAVSSEDLVTAVRRSGAAFKAAGGNLNELFALFASVRGMTRESAESIATGLRTIFTRLQRPGALENLRQLGVELRFTREEAERMGDLGLTNQFVGPFEAIKRLGDALKGLRTTDIRFANLSEELGGYRQVEKTIPLLRNTAEAQKALNVAIFGSVPISRSAADAQQSWAVQLEKLQERFYGVVRTIGQTTSFKAFADSLFVAANATAKLVESLAPLVPILTGLAAVKLGSSIFSMFSGRLGPSRLAGGGSVPGRGDTDSVPAMLTPGEFVIRKSAAQAIGYSRLNQMNVRGYATGGEVPGQPSHITKLKDLYERSHQASFAEIDATVAGLSGLNKDELYGVATGFGMRIPKAWGKKRILEDIARKLIEAKGSAIRISPISGPTDGTTYFAEGGQVYPFAPNNLDWVYQNAHKYDPLFKSGLSPRGQAAAVRGLAAQQGPPDIYPFAADPRSSFGFAAAQESPFSDLLDRERLRNRTTTALGGGELFGPPRPSRFQMLRSQASGLGINGSRIGYGLAVASAFAPSAIQSITGNVEQNQTTAATVGEGLSGMFTGGATGASLGFAVGGPWGAAVGGAIGAIGGLIAGFKDAKERIEQIKFDKLATQVNTAIAGIASDASPMTEAKLKRASVEFGGLLGKTDARTMAKFGNENPLVFLEKLGEERQKTLSGSLPNLVNIANRSIEDAAKQGTPNAVGRLASTGVIRNIAIASGRSEQEVTENFKKLADEVNRNIAAQKRQTELVVRENAMLNNLQQLANAVSLAGDGLTSLHNEARLLADTFSGQITQVGPTGSSSTLKLLGTAGGESAVMESLRRFTPLLGESGGFLEGRTQSVQRLMSSMPGIIGRFHGGLGEEGAFPDFLKRELGGRGIDQQDIASVFTRASAIAERPGELGRHLLNPSAFAKTLGQDQTEQVRQTTIHIAKEIEDHEGRLVAAIGKLMEMRRRQIQEEVGIENVRLTHLRVMAQRAAEAAGREHDPLSFLTVGQLQAPVTALQTRLTGLQGPAAFSPAAIESKFDDVFKKMKEVQEQRDKTSALSPEAIKLTRTFGELQAQAIHLKEGMGELAKAHLNAALQEKLAGLDQERGQRLTFGEGLLRGGPLAGFQANQGAALAMVAARQGHVGNFAPMQVNSLFDFLDKLSHVPLQGLGGIKGEDLKSNLIRGTLGVANLPPNQEQQRNLLLAQIQVNTAKAVDAQTKSADMQEKLTDLFEKNIGDTVKKAIDDLTSLLKGVRQGELLEHRAGIQGSDAFRTGARTVAGGEFLRSIGVSSQEQLTKLQENTALVTDLRAAMTGRDQLGQRRKDVLSRLGGLNLGEAGIPGVRRQLNDAGMTPDEIASVENGLGEGSIRQRGLAILRSRGQSPIRQSFAQRQALRQEALNQLAHENVATMFDFRGAKLDTRVNALGSRLTAQTGVSAGAVTGANAGKFDEAIKLVSNLDQANKALDSFSEALQRNADQLRALGYVDRAGVSKAIASIGIGMNPLGALAMHHAAGGSIFTPKGGDTVPAMLTPGEFVVNAHSAAANKDLLRKINRTKGPVHLAGGGDDEDFGYPSRGITVAASGDGRVHRNKKAEAEAEASGRRYYYAGLNGGYSGLRPGEGVMGGASSFRPPSADSGFRPPAAPSMGIDVPHTRARPRPRVANPRQIGPDPGNWVTPTPGFQGGFQKGPPGGFGNQRVGPPTWLEQKLQEGAVGAQPAGQPQGNMGALAQQFTVFAGASQALAKAMEGFPKTISMKGEHTHTVTVFGIEGGADALSKAIQERVVKVVDDKLAQYHKDNFPEQPKA